MFSRPSSPKIRPDHLDRLAVIYVRQSTSLQVREHRGSTTRQYDLVKRAQDLGWTPASIQVVDQDQGQSGSSSLGRDGFQWLVAEVGLGHVGAVLSLEVSRLARSCSDWYRLLEICALSETLVIDEEGIYDPGAHNDRLLLGFKGTMSEAELHWLHQRLQGGKVAKAEQGQLRFRLPLGLVYDPVGNIVLDPDEAVQEAVRLVFALFEHYHSALAVVSALAEQHLRFPTRWWGGKQAGELIWGRLTHERVLNILHCPLYAGAYVYGRTQFRRRALPGEEPRIKGRTRRIKQEDWPIVLLDAHPGYISWEQFLHHQRQLDENRTWRAEEHPGAIREGPSLLQGIVLCGSCGRRMTIRYQRNGSLLMYECHQIHSQLAGKTCQTMRGDRIDQAVVQCFLQAIEPAHLEVALSALDQVEAQARQVEQQWQRQIERAQYEADLARRRYRAVDPDNRLVARSLEREWNEKLGEVEKLEREYAMQPKHAVLSLTASQREQIRRLAQDLPAIWHAPTTTFAQRKQLLRWLIKDVTLSKRGNVIDVAIRWQTEALTRLAILRHKKSWEERQTSQEVVARVRELSPPHTNAQIAAKLNEEGERAGMGGSFTTSKIEWIRYAYHIPTGCPERPRAAPTGQRGDGRYSARAAAELLNVDVSTIAEWCKTGRLESVRSTPLGPRWVTLTPEIISALRKPIKRKWKRHQAQRGKQPVVK
ncbi:recombinase family protein [Ktedonobacter racemifer]|uniref:Resolvase domain protein n=1 Tax=Ktedonobacter racemifer DSM 44963 TaxID=485913 RepID=D6TK65_KTERA|nr:recombinase family protein [Ktedonobacter racemifer]EFH86165.1 Resolvase domain protein [Ktedonobacter racemifer DSM 44963]